MRVSKWATGLGLRLLRAIVPELHMVMVRRRASPEELLQQLRTQRRRAPRDFRFSRDDANSRH
jgi:hypothetical protein